MIARLAFVAGCIALGVVDLLASDWGSAALCFVLAPAFLGITLHDAREARVLILGEADEAP
jgi:hypothetical protein